MKAVKIERPRKEDVLKIHDFFDLMIRDLYKKNGLNDLKEIMQEEKTHKRSCLRQDFDSNGKDRYFLIAKVGTKVVGTIEYGPSNEIIKNADNALNKIKEVGTVYVHPEYQGQGIGRKLLHGMGLALEEAGYESCVLDSGYPLAQKVWRHKFGEPFLLLKDYWGEGMDHMIWHVESSDLLDKNAELHKLRMKVLEEGFSVCRLEKDSLIPSWAFDGVWSSVTKTEDELSIVCETEVVEIHTTNNHLTDNGDAIKVEKGWRALKVLGPLDFVMIGILAAVADNLAEAGISIFAVSTYDTDYVLLKDVLLDKAIKVLEEDDRFVIYR